MNLAKLKEITIVYIILKILLYPLVIIRRRFIKKDFYSKKIVVENLQHLIMNDPIIKMKEFEGVFYMDVRSDIFSRIALNEKYEPLLVQYCLKYLDRHKDVIDVGANLGFYSILFAKHLLTGKVVSIEPTPNALNRLRKNINLNEVSDKVVIFEGVASNQNGIVDINIIEGKEEYSSLGEMSHPKIVNHEAKKIQVKSTMLDKVVDEMELNPGFLKVDVEGAEKLVFEGSQNLLEKQRPVILSELSNHLLTKNKTSAQEIIRFIQSYAYDVYDPIHPSKNPGEEQFGDIICFPKEMNISL